MDILFQDFLEHKYEKLTPPQQLAFEKLLDETDPDIYAWITGSSSPQDPEYAFLINSMRTGHGRNMP